MGMFLALVFATAVRVGIVATHNSISRSSVTSLSVSYVAVTKLLKCVNILKLSVSWNGFSLTRRQDLLVAVAIRLTDVTGSIVTIVAFRQSAVRTVCWREIHSGVTTAIVRPLVASLLVAARVRLLIHRTYKRILDVAPKTIGALARINGLLVSVFVFTIIITTTMFRGRRMVNLTRPCSN